MTDPSHSEFRFQNITYVSVCVSAWDALVWDVFATCLGGVWRCLVACMYGSRCGHTHVHRRGMSVTVNNAQPSHPRRPPHNKTRTQPLVNGGEESLAFFSSYGPTPDGRFKPDLVAPGQRLISASSGAGLRAVESESARVCLCVFKNETKARPVFVCVCGLVCVFGGVWVCGCACATFRCLAWCGCGCKWVHVHVCG